MEEEMEIDTNWDVNKYHTPHEPTHHWELRKKFMEENKGRYSEERLVCLGQVFANIEFMGCRYPKVTMDLVEEMAFGIVQPYRESQKDRLQRTFVSGSAAASGKVNRVKTSQPVKSKDPDQGGPPAKKAHYSNFVRASSTSSTTNEPKPEQTSSNYSQSDQANSTSSSTDPKPTQLISSNSNYSQFVRASSNSSTSTNEPKPQQISSNYSQFVRASSTSNTNEPKTQQQLYSNTKRSKYDVIIVKLEYMPEENPCNILNRSAAFSKTSITWEIVKGPGVGTPGAIDNYHRCNMKLQNDIIHTALGNSKAEARDKAAKETLEMFEENCYSILVKNKYLSDGTTINANELEAVPEEKKVISGSNIGHKLLKMMGWTGGGLGEGGSGISEPITATSIINREGFGTKNSTTIFKRKIRQIVEEYASSTNPYDLVFTSGFDNEQRKEMHMIAKRLGLKSKSYGKDDDRFITISRKFDANQLIEELKRQGGSTEKYELIYPK